MMLKNTIKLLAILPLFSSIASSSSRAPLGNITNNYQLNTPAPTHILHACPKAPITKRLTFAEKFTEECEQEIYKNEMLSLSLICGKKISKISKINLEEINKLDNGEYLVGSEICKIMKSFIGERPLTHQEKADATAAQERAAREAEIRAENGGVMPDLWRNFLADPQFQNPMQINLMQAFNAAYDAQL